MKEWNENEDGKKCVMRAWQNASVDFEIVEPNPNEEQRWIENIPKHLPVSQPTGTGSDTHTNPDACILVYSLALVWNNQANVYLLVKKCLLTSTSNIHGQAVSKTPVYLHAHGSPMCRWLTVIQKQLHRMETHQYDEKTALQCFKHFSWVSRMWLLTCSGWLLRGSTPSHYILNHF